MRSILLRANRRGLRELTANMGLTPTESLTWRPSRLVDWILDELPKPHITEEMLNLSETMRAQCPSSLHTQLVDTWKAHREDAAAQAPGRAFRVRDEQAMADGQQGVMTPLRMAEVRNQFVLLEFLSRCSMHIATTGTAWERFISDPGALRGIAEDVAEALNRSPLALLSGGFSVNEGDPATLRITGSAPGVLPCTLENVMQVLALEDAESLRAARTDLQALRLRAQRMEQTLRDLNRDKRNRSAQLCGVETMNETLKEDKARLESRVSELELRLGIRGPECGRKGRFADL